MFPQLPADLSTLSDEDLQNLLSEFTAAFNENAADPGKLSAEDVAALGAGTEAIEKLRTEQDARATAASQLAEQVAQLSSRVNGEDGDDEGGEGQEGDQGDGEGGDAGDGDQGGDANGGGEGEGEQGGSGDGAGEGGVQAGGENRPAAKGGAVANMRANSPARTRPRSEARSSANAPYITASAEGPGIGAGQRVKDFRQVSELMVERHRTIGEGNGDRANVVRFNRNVPTDRQIPKGISYSDLKEFLGNFSRNRDSIRAAGGLCAPVENYYDIQVLANADRPVRNSLANFQASRGGIKYMPPPTMAQITSGIDVITAAQDASNATKGVFTVTCPSPVEVDIAAIYNQIKYGNFGARSWPEAVEAWDELSLAKQASRAEQFLLDQISAWCVTNNTQVTTTGTVGAGRELFSRLARAAAGYRNRNRMDPSAMLTVMLPAWSLNLVSSDLYLTFTDNPGFFRMSPSDVEALFGDQNLDPVFYVDSKTGGGQLFGAVGSGYAGTGRTITDAVTNTDTSLVSATAAFTANDVGSTVTGPGIFAGTTISTVTNGTTVVLSHATTATATGVTVRFNGFILAEYPTTVDTFLFPTGSILHLDGGTLDLGLVRDTTTNTSNQFVTFTEEFENIAVIGVEVDEIIFGLNADGSYAAARTISTPVKN